MRQANQKLKLLYLERIFREQTDDEHGLSLSELTARLAAVGIPVERKTLVSDIECLQLMGLDIYTDRGKRNKYKLASREFETAELKLLTDAVQSSRFITENKSRHLIKKLEKLMSTHEAKKIDSQVFICNRVKTTNEKIYYAIDAINKAIAAEKKLTFRYFEYGPDKSPRYRNNEEHYKVSPYALCWDDENYYMISDHEGRAGLNHFRVDKMLDVSVTDERAQKCPAGFEPARYAKSLFGMFGGVEYNARLKFHNSLIGVVLDRFGMDTAVQTDGDYIKVSVDVVASPVFYGWVFQLGNKAEILGPKELRDTMRDYVNSVAAVYS